MEERAETEFLESPVPSRYHQREGRFSTWIRVSTVECGMVVFRRQIHGKRRWRRNISVFVSLFFFVGHVGSLSDSKTFRTLSTMLHAERKCLISEQSESHSGGNENGTDKYAYVHLSIREVLKMKPCSLKSGFVSSESQNTEIHTPTLVDKDRCIINWDVLDDFIEHGSLKSENAEVLSVEQLVYLASQSESILIIDNETRHKMLPLPIRGLFQIIPERYLLNQKSCSSDDGGEYFLIATLLALNMVENSIRHLLGKQNGKAPLLKDMIDMMAVRKGPDVLPTSLLRVLKTLLLPKDGINLRNLLWHGFLPTIHPRWFALSVVLTLSLDELAGSSSFQIISSDKSLETISAMRRYEQLVTILDCGRAIILSPDEMTTFEEKVIQSNVIPSSHFDLFRVSLKFVDHPIMFASVAGPLIEHIMRLMWCEENKQNKSVAEPGSYYVTLDGHGQRDKHEVVIMPYFSPTQQKDDALIKNQLVYRLGGSRMAFLMDMFTSPAGAPNIRASVAHGSFNNHLFEELAKLEGKEDIVMKDDELRDMTSALILVLRALSDCGKDHKFNSYTISPEDNDAISLYKPCFSYSALLLAELDSMVTNLKPLYKFVCDGRHLKYSKTISQSKIQEEIAHKVAAMSQSVDTITGMQKCIHQSFGVTKSKFTDESFFQDNTNNLSASECGAAKLLLSEIAQAASSSLKDLNNGIALLENGKIQLSSRRRKQVYRICSSAKLTLDFYSFAAYCALLFIERRQDNVTVPQHINLHGRIARTLTDEELFVAVKRSRMTLSTFSTTKTFDRALSALSHYTAGKAVKAISKSID
mmetsp:Transcript_33265/g.78553  ORF Transcript_33265/g.78553 Transcript_33265/m.78553 type:complete len:813 (+) Transcript_33265:149-2587(+)